MECLVEEPGPSLTPCEMKMVSLAIAEEVLRSHIHIVSPQYCSQPTETLHSIVLNFHFNPFATFPTTNLHFNLFCVNEC